MAADDQEATPQSEGLRERRRRRTLAQLEEAALRLFDERGYDAVTVDDIAAAVDVSRRTFFRYFPGKEDVLFADYQERAETLRRALAARPPDEPPLTALRRALMSMTTPSEIDRERLLRRARIMEATPSLQARALAHQRTGEQFVAELLAERLGVDAVTDLRPALVAATTLAAVRVAFYAWLAGGGEGDLPALVGEALDLLDGGLQEGITPAETEKPARRRRMPAATPGPRRTRAR
jgi:AcrR family transcriptional regulator